MPEPQGRRVLRVLLQERREPSVPTGQPEPSEPQVRRGRQELQEQRVRQGQRVLLLRRRDLRQELRRRQQDLRQELRRQVREPVQSRAKLFRRDRRVLSGHLPRSGTQFRQGVDADRSDPEAGVIFRRSYASADKDRRTVRPAAAAHRTRQKAF